MDKSKIQYKTNKYFTKYNNSINSVNKLYYGRKYLQYAQANLKQTGGTDKGNYESIKNMFNTIGEQIQNISKHIEELKNKSNKKLDKNIIQVINSFDNSIKNNIMEGYSGYKEPMDLENYYTDIAAQCKEIFIE